LTDVPRPTYGRRIRPRTAGPFGSTARARIALSAAARSLSDGARALVPTYSDGLARPGAFVRDAHALAVAAEAALARAIVLEREQGTSWGEIGQALGFDATTARQRFEGLVSEWSDALRATWREDERGSLSCRLPAGAEAPEEWALRLDAWVLAHREPVEPDPGRAPVSGRLPRAAMIDEINELLEALNDEHYLASTGAERRAWLERKVRVLEQLGELEPEYRDTCVAPLTVARRHLERARQDEARDRAGRLQ
jgi:hypothetical protein